MRLTLAAVGRLKKGPEHELARRYGDRLINSGRTVGLSGIRVLEIVESRASNAATRKREEASDLLARLPENACMFVFDEKGKSPSSLEFAKMLRSQMDSGTRDLVLTIGGPDGLDASLRQAAREVISFGRLTIPHQLVRILVLEQAYRATTILANHPYHRP